LSARASTRSGSIPRSEKFTVVYYLTSLVEPSLGGIAFFAV